MRRHQVAGPRGIRYEYHLVFVFHLQRWDTLASNRCQASLVNKKNLLKKFADLDMNNIDDVTNWLHQINDEQ